MVLTKIISTVIASNLHLFNVPLTISEATVLDYSHKTIAEESVYTVEMPLDLLSFSAFHLGSDDLFPKNSFGMSFLENDYSISARYFKKDNQVDISASAKMKLFNTNLQFGLNHRFGKKNLTLVSYNVPLPHGSLNIELELVDNIPCKVYGNYLIRF